MYFSSYLTKGLSTFADELVDTNLVIWSDNKGAEGSLRHGRIAPSLAHVQLRGLIRCRPLQELRSQLPPSLHVEESHPTSPQHVC